MWKIKAEIKLLRAFTKAEGYMPLANHLGLKSTTTISHWFKANRIPKNKFKQVMEFLDAWQSNKRAAEEADMSSDSRD